MAGRFTGRCLGYSKNLANPDDFQWPVPLLQLGNADTVTACQTTKCFAPAHDMPGSMQVAITGGSKMHIECRKFVIRLAVFTIDRHQQCLSGADSGTPGKSIH